MTFRYIPIFWAVLLTTIPFSVHSATIGNRLPSGQTNEDHFELSGKYDYGVVVAGNIHSVNSETIKINTTRDSSTQTAGLFVQYNVNNDTVLNLGKKDVTQSVNISVKDEDPNASNTIMGLAVLGNPKNKANKVELNIVTDDLTLKAQSQTGLVYGVMAQNSTTDDNKVSEFATLNINSKNTFIDVNSGINQNASAIVAFSQGEVNIEGNLFVNTQGGSGKAITTRGDATININQSGRNTVVMNGNVNFSFYEPNSGTPVDSNVNINLTGANSSWTGNSIVSWKGTPTPEDVILNVKGFNLRLADSATWTPTLTPQDSTTQQMGSKYVALNNLKLDNGIVNITGHDIDVTVENIEGSGTINLATDLDVDIDNATGKFNVLTGKNASLDVNLMDKNLSKEWTADDISAEKASQLLANVGGENVQTTTQVKEGMVNPAYKTDKNGHTVSLGPNTLLQSSLELASVAPLALNRIMLSDMRKRLGDIRTTSGIHGAWARYDGGKLTGKGGLENDFRTIEVGIDTVPTPDSARFGVAFSYTDSDAQYVRGSADMKAYSLAMYATKMLDNGMFVDVIGRMGTMDTDLMVDGQYKGSMSNVALSVSGEMGWRFDLTDMIYVEPQLEATYTYVNDDKLSLSSANYDIDAVNSLMGRIGFAAGLKCPGNFGNAYVRASAVHEFLGDAKITGLNGNSRNSYSIDGGDTWIEYGIGANFNVSKNTYFWTDVERTTGGSLDEDWRATFGVRYTW